MCDEASNNIFEFIIMVINPFWRGFGCGLFERILGFIFIDFKGKLFRKLSK